MEEKIFFPKCQQLLTMYIKVITNFYFLHNVSVLFVFIYITFKIRKNYCTRKQKTKTLHCQHQGIPSPLTPHHFTD